MLCKKCGNLILAKEQVCTSCGGVNEEPRERDYAEYPWASWMTFDQHEVAENHLKADLKAAKDLTDILRIREGNDNAKRVNKKDIDHVTYYYEREKLILFYGFEQGFMTREELKEFLVVLENAVLAEAIVLVHLCENKKRLYEVCGVERLVRDFCALNEEMLEQAQNVYREVLGKSADILGKEKEYFNIRTMEAHFDETERYFRSEEAQNRDVTEALYDMCVYECIDRCERSCYKNSFIVNDRSAGYLGVLRALEQYGEKKKFSLATSMPGIIKRLEGYLLNCSVTNLTQVELSKRGTKEIQEHKTFLRNELAKCKYYTDVKLVKGALGGGCYIATAVYGSYDAREVVKLREFRDNVLAKRVLGRAFIKAYYAVSPWFSVRMKRFKRLNGLIKRCLDFFVERL